MRTIIISLSVVGVISISLTGYMIYSYKQKQIVTSNAQPIAYPSAQPTIVEQTTQYKDDSGFSFQYPESYTVKKADILGNDEYANLMLSSSKVAGTVQLKIANTLLKTTNDWASNDPQLSTQAQISPVQFGKLTASQLIFNNVYKAGVVDQGVLFTLTTDGNNDRVINAYKTILQSFAFFLVPPATQSAQVASSSDSDVILENEEVVQ